MNTDYVEAIRLVEAGGIVLRSLVSAHFAFARRRICSKGTNMFGLTVMFVF